MARRIFLAGGIKNAWADQPQLRAGPEMCQGDGYRLRLRPHIRIENQNGGILRDQGLIRKNVVSQNKIIGATVPEVWLLWQKSVWPGECALNQGLAFTFVQVNGAIMG